MKYGILHLLRKIVQNKILKIQTTFDCLITVHSSLLGLFTELHV